MRKTLAFACALLAVSASNAASQSYGKEVSNEWRKALSIDKADGEYRWSGYPVDNFGLLTFYDPPADRKKWTDADRICATWTCIDVSYQNVPTKFEDRIALMGFADVAKGGPVTLSENKKKELGVGVVLSGLLSVVGINAKLDWSKGVTTEMSLGPVYRRSVNRDRMLTFLGKDAKNQLLKRQFANGRLTYIAADIVAESIDVTVKVDSKLNPQLEATLTKAVPAVTDAAAKADPAAAAKSPSVTVSFLSTAAGTYKLSVKNPVVLAVQSRRQPGAGSLVDAQGKPENEPIPAPVFVGFYPASRK